MAPVKNGFHEHCSACSERYLSQWVSGRVGVPFRSNLPPSSPHLILNLRVGLPGGAPGPVKHLCCCHHFRGRPALPTPLCHPPRQSRLPLSTRPTWLQGPLQSGLAEEGEPSHFSRELLREPAPLPLAGGDRANILSSILLLFLSGRVWTLV